MRGARYHRKAGPRRLKQNVRSVVHQYQAGHFVHSHLRECERGSHRGPGDARERRGGLDHAVDDRREVERVDAVFLRDRRGVAKLVESIRRHEVVRASRHLVAVRRAGATHDERRGRARGDGAALAAPAHSLAAEAHRDAKRPRTIDDVGTLVHATPDRRHRTRVVGAVDGKPKIVVRVRLFVSKGVVRLHAECGLTPRAGHAQPIAVHLGCSRGR